MFGAYVRHLVGRILRGIEPLQKCRLTRGQFLCRANESFLGGHTFVPKCGYYGIHFQIFSRLVDIDSYASFSFTFVNNRVLSSTHCGARANLDTA